MKRRVVIVSAAILVAALACAGVACQEPRNPGTDDLDRLDLAPGKGRVIGIVTDSEEFLSKGETPQTYDGALILVSQAVEAGTCKLSKEEPEQTLYDVGEEVGEQESGEDGYWQVDLEPGKYFIRALYGGQSYSQDMFIEVQEGSIQHVSLELIHGV